MQHLISGGMEPREEVTMLPMQQIWLAIDARQVGGIEVHIIHLANDLLARGFRPTIVLVSNHGMTPLRPCSNNRACPMRCAKTAATLCAVWLASLLLC